MKKVTSIIYLIRIILFIIHLLMLYMMIDDIIYISFGYLFLFVDIIYVISVLWYRLTLGNIWGKALLLYLKTNYIILSILFLFLIFYSVYLIHKMNDK